MGNKVLACRFLLLGFLLILPFECLDFFFVIPLSLGLPPFFAPLCPSVFLALSLDLDWWVWIHKTHLQDLSVEAVCVCGCVRVCACTHACDEEKECRVCVRACVFVCHLPLKAGIATMTFAPFFLPRHPLCPASSLRVGDDWTTPESDASGRRGTEWMER